MSASKFGKKNNLFSKSIQNKDLLATISLALFLVVQIINDG